MDFKIPTTLETDRLILRTFKEDDWKDLYAYYSDPECMKYTIRKTLNEGETWRTMSSMIGHWQLRKFGPYALELKESSKVIGVSGMWYPNDWPEPEIKWGIVTEYQRKGYAKEAVSKIKEMVKDYLPGQSLISLIDAANVASERLALSVGATLEKSIIFREIECNIFRHDLT